MNGIALHSKRNAAREVRTLIIIAIIIAFFLCQGMKVAFSVEIKANRQTSVEIEEIGQFDDNIGGTAIDVFVQNNTAYLANDEKGLLIINVSDPQNPVIKGRWNNYAGVSKIIIMENIAFLSEKDGGLVILDCINLSSPKFLGQFNDGNEYSSKSMKKIVISQVEILESSSP